MIHQYLARIHATLYARSDISFHYQRPDGTCVVRYDNAPHHPQVSTFPDHKHMDDRIEAAEPPDLSEVLREIDGILYPQQRNDERV